MKAIAVVVSLLVAVTSLAAAERESVPRLLKISGALSAEAPERSSSRVAGVTFSIYKERDDETPLWTTTQNVAIDADGRFTILLGEAEKDGIPIEIFTSGEARWLGMQRIPEREMERIMLASVPYAIKAYDADTLGGKPLSAFVLSEAKTDRKLKPVVDGAAGFIAKFIDTTNIDNSILFESAGRLGLSTTSPQAPLHINSVVTYRNAGVASIQRGNNPGIMLENPLSNNSVLLSESFGFVVFASTSATVPLAASDQRFVVRPSGNVGIAVNNPLVPLHIAGVKTYRGLNTTTVQSGTNPGLMLENPATNSTVALTENGGLAIYTSPSSTLPFTGSDLKMVLTTAGNLGIGVISPSKRLDVGGNAGISGTLTFPVTPADGSAGVIIFGSNRFAHIAGTNNVFLGTRAGNFALTGTGNTGTGSSALSSETSGFSNVANGAFALLQNTIGCCNTAIGVEAMSSNVGGDNNTATGVQALQNNDGSQNTGLGAFALRSNTTGSFNVGIGYGAGGHLTFGSYNIDISHDGVAGESGTIRIGTAGFQTKAFLAGVRGVTTGAADALGVVIDSNGQLGTLSSSATKKRDITSIAEASSQFLNLRPVSFFYRNDTAGARQYGLIAEEVAEVMPELVQFSPSGEPQTVRYHFLAPLLLNEVKKQRETIETQAARLKDFEERLRRLEAKASGQQ